MRQSVRRRSLLVTTILFFGPLLEETSAQTPRSPASPASSAASGNKSRGPEVVVVKGRSLRSKAQHAPASVVEVTGRELQERGITSFSALAQATPGVSLKSEGPSQNEVEMRGMTSSGGHASTVGFNLDSTPLTGSANAQNGHVVIDPSLYDLNHIEMLRGPQGTTGGVASMGGSARLVTNQPDPTRIDASVESMLSGTVGGGFNHDDNIMANLPLIRDKLAIRIVGTEDYTSGWIDRIVGSPFPLPTADGAVRGNVAGAPVEKDYPGANAYQIYSTRISLLWRPTENLEITPSFFYETSRQNGISAYDSVPGTDAHYQPFDIAEPLTDRIAVYSLNMRYHFEYFDLTSDTAQWWRQSTQTEDASENFNNPQTGETYASDNGLANPGYYGKAGTGEAYGHEIDPSQQFSEEVKLTSHDTGRLGWVFGTYYSHFESTWNFTGTTPNPYPYEDLGTFARATTPNWFDAYSPTSEDQYAVFGNATYALTSRLKADIGVRWTDYNYRFSSCISGWGSGLGAATPSCSGVIKLNESSATPRFNLSYDVNTDLMVYATISRGFRPGGGDAVYPTTGAYWSNVFAPYGYTNGKWPSTYKPDSVWSYEIGEKATLLNGRLLLNADVYYEDWSNIQLEAYPGDWALNINGNNAKLYGAEFEALGKIGYGFNIDATLGYVRDYLNSGPHWLIQPTDVLPEVAPVVGDVTLNYTHKLNDRYTFNATLDNSYTGPRYSLAFPFGFSTNGEYVQLKSYDLTNFRMGIASTHGWAASIFLNNMFNKRAQLESLYQEAVPDAAFNRVVTNQPLTIGVDLTYHL